MVYGNSLEERTMLRGRIASRRATIALTPNESVNYLYAKRVREHFRGVKNIVALGALNAATDLFPEQTFKTAIAEALRSKCALIPLNEEAYARGVETFRHLNP